MQQHDKSKQPFSTRFLPSDGIPAYNALLDSHLGRRREFLLGNSKSLELLQRTGAIARVEVRDENPNQYVVYMTDKNPMTPQRHYQLQRQQQQQQRHRQQQEEQENKHLEQHLQALTLSSSSSSTGDVQPETTSSHTTNPKPKVIQPLRAGLVNPKPVTGLLTASASSSAGVAKPRSMVRHSQSTGVLPCKSHGWHRPPNVNHLSIKEDEDSDMHGDAHGMFTSSDSSSSPVNRRRRRRASESTGIPVGAVGRVAGISDLLLVRRRPPTSKSSTATTKGVMEHLLDNDAAFESKIRHMKEEMQQIDQEKTLLDAEITRLRKHLRGVNAVRENDVAVAHCSSIMQHRLSKAEEEYMKVVTCQSQVRQQVDRIRQEILSLHKVKRKLIEDIEEITLEHAAMEEKIRSSKTLRNEVAQDLVELERKAEIEAEERKLKQLLPEEDVVIDVERLMKAVSERNNSRQKHIETMSANFELAKLNIMALNNAVKCPSGAGGSIRPISTPNSSLSSIMSSSSSHGSGSRQGSCLKHHHLTLNYRNAFKVIQKSLGCGEMDDFVNSFIETENQLMSKYKLNERLEEEYDALRKQLTVLTHESAARNESLRGSQRQLVDAERVVQRKISNVHNKIKSYKSLLEQRNSEDERLRALMQRCLETLKAEKLVVRRDSLTGSAMMNEVSSLTILDHLQKKVTDTVMTLRLKQAADGIPSTHETVPLLSAASQRHRDARRIAATNSARFSMGPREPTGTIVHAIQTAVQPPSVENESGAAGGSMFGGTSGSMSSDCNSPGSNSNSREIAVFDAEAFRQENDHREVFARNKSCHSGSQGGPKHSKSKSRSSFRAVKEEKEDAGDEADAVQDEDNDNDNDKEEVELEAEEATEAYLKRFFSGSSLSITVDDS